MFGSRAARGAVGKMERSMGGARYMSSSVCQEVDTAGKDVMGTDQFSLLCYVISLFLVQWILFARHRVFDVAQTSGDEAQLDQLQST